MATLTKRDLVSAELLDDRLRVAGVSARVGPAVIVVRGKYGERQRYENLAALPTV